MKVYSLSNFVISLVSFGLIVYTWISGNTESSTIVLLSFLAMAVAYAYSGLTKKGYVDYLAHLEILKKNLSKRAKRFSHVIYNAPIVFILIASVIEITLPSWRWVIVTMVVMGFAIQFRIKTAKTQQGIQE